MRWKSLCLLAAVLSGIVTIQVFANSAPVRMYGYPSSAIMSIEESSPIEVEGEELSFDLSRDSGRQGQVTATYAMFNSGDEAQTSQMAFPYIGTLLELTEEEPVVRVDGKEVPYTVHIGDRIGGDTLREREAAVEAFDMRSILESLARGAYEPVSFDRKATGKTYRIKAWPGGDDAVSLVLRFDLDEEKTRLVANGFNGYGRSGRAVELTGWMDRERTFDFHVQGEDVAVRVEALLLRGSGPVRTEDFGYEVSVEAQSFEAYLEGLLEVLPVNRAVHGTDLENLYLKALDDGFIAMQGLTTENELHAAVSEDRYLLLRYEVPFPGKGRRSVEVSYTAEATLDRSTTTMPTYTFTYLLSPAAHWKDFRNLRVEVRTGEKAPYLIGSSMSMERTEDRLYRATLETLPEEDLTFTLYHKPEITLEDRIQGTMHRRLGFAYPLVIVFLGLMLLTILLLSVTAILRRGQKA